MAIATRLSALLLLLLSGCAGVRQITRDEALWRNGCLSRGGQIVEQEGEVYCVRER